MKELILVVDMMTLVIMAAGMGSRYGGLKQIEPVHDNGEFILDYSIYDAIKAGFNKIVFIIKKENYDIFRRTIGKRIENVIAVKYVFQENDNLPDFVNLPAWRLKPLGTAHAILCCKDTVDETFTIINADDFYGRDAFMVASKFMQEHPNEFAMVGYLTANTLTENGAVKRGICKTEAGILTEIVESNVERVAGKIVASPLTKKEKFVVADNQLVSMNMFIFPPRVFAFLESEFVEFFKDPSTDILNSEYLVPIVIGKLIALDKIKVHVLPTKAKWYGITYKEDKPSLVAGINKLVKEHVYPEKLW